MQQKMPFVKFGPDLKIKNNGYSHVQAALLGPSLSVPVRDAALVTGTWQQVVVINHDNKPRNRKIALTLTDM